MAVAFRSSATTQINNASSVNATTPAGATTGDIIIAQINLEDIGSTVISATAGGWTQIYQTDGGTAICAVFWRAATGSEPGTYNFTFTGGNNYGMAGLAAISGCDTSTPVLDFSNSGNTGTAYSTTTITPSVADCLIIQLVATHSTTTVPRTTTGYTIVTSPPTFTERYDTGESNVGMGIAFATGPRTQTTATGTGSATVSGNTNGGIMGMLAIQPPNPTSIKTINGLAKASVKTVNGLAIASVKTLQGLT